MTKDKLIHRERRIGRFYFMPQIINDPKEVRALFACIMPLRVENLIVRDATEVIAWSEKFDIIAWGEEPPEYQVVMHKTFHKGADGKIKKCSADFKRLG